MKRVVGFGALNVDNIFKVENLKMSENSAYPIDVQAGGNAANTISALAKLGVACGFIGLVASDAYGKLILSEFKKRKIDTSNINVRKQEGFSNSSGIVETYVDKRGNRALFVKPGANNTLRESDINMNYIKAFDYIHISSFVDSKQLEVQKKIVAKLPKNLKVSFAPGSLYVHRGLKAVLPIIKNTYLLTLAKNEAYHLTGKNYKKAAEYLISLGPKIVVITQGKEGCYIATKHSTFTQKARKVSVIDTTGAGDAFIAGFLFGLLNNQSMGKCAQIGNAIASFSVQNIGARAGLPNRKELTTIVSLVK